MLNIYNQSANFSLKRRLQRPALRERSQPVLTDHLPQLRLVPSPAKQHSRLSVRPRLGRRQLRLRHPRMRLRTVPERRHLCRAHTAQHQVLLPLRLHRHSLRDPHRPLRHPEPLSEQGRLHQHPGQLAARHTLPVSYRLHRRQLSDDHQRV